MARTRTSGVLGPAPGYRNRLLSLFFLCLWNAAPNRGSAASHGHQSDLISGRLQAKESAQQKPSRLEANSSSLVISASDFLCWALSRKASNEWAERKTTPSLFVSCFLHVVSLVSVRYTSAALPAA
ncbi:hypothetical protein N656DRAFT_475304 [Canariomyces notabilis]|uniref:Secreted protein n=1 Tax=Canariomyces notabilis TaxID=2074819 RepID=A0AAN6TIW7_9PEZI|nr:hypothetical protein N656DRAFT_475304 [Canariomyces arenarius]